MSLSAHTRLAICAIQVAQRGGRDTVEQRWHVHQIKLFVVSPSSPRRRPRHALQAVNRRSSRIAGPPTSRLQRGGASGTFPSFPMDHTHLLGRSLLTLSDFPASDIRMLLDLARQAKADRRAGRVQQRFRGRSLAMLYEKPSTRTRCAFDTAFGEEGGHPVFLTGQEIHLGEKETLEDTARVLGRMFDAIQFRGFRAAHGGGARQLFRRAGLQRSHRLPPSDPGARRSAHPRGTPRDARRLEAGVRRRLPQQHRQLAADRLRPDGPAVRGRRAG